MRIYSDFFLLTTDKIFIYRFTLIHGEEWDYDQSINKSDNKELFTESIIINELSPYALEKCITIQWPEFDIEKNSYVIINFTKKYNIWKLGKHY